MSGDWLETLHIGKDLYGEIRMPVPASVREPAMLVAVIAQLKAGSADNVFLNVRINALDVFLSPVPVAAWASLPLLRIDRPVSGADHVCIRAVTLRAEDDGVFPYLEVFPVLRAWTPGDPRPWQTPGGAF